MPDQPRRWIDRVLDLGRAVASGPGLPQQKIRSLGQAFASVWIDLGLDAAIGFRVTVDGRPKELRPVVRNEAYRIGREAIVNAYCHSRAKDIDVLVEFRPTRLRVVVLDNGYGIDPHRLDRKPNACRGLQKMRERADRIGGRIRIFSRIGVGTEVELRVGDSRRLPTE